MSVPLRKSLIAALLFVVASSTHAAEAKRKIACKTPQNMASCSWIHGRLSISNGDPSLRLWHIPGHHLYGIYSSPYGFANDSRLLDNEDPELPQNLEAALNRTQENPFGNVVFANFEICPLEPLHKGAMQAACIQAARHIVVQ